MRIVLVAVLACHGSAPSSPTPGRRTDGTERAVCAWGNRHPQETPEPAACRDGLQCCYPCGIDGCDSVCMNVTECPAIP